MANGATDLASVAGRFCEKPAGRIPPISGHEKGCYIAQMKRLASCLLPVLATFMLVSPAHACRVMMPPQKLVEEAYSKHGDLRVALVSITASQHLQVTNKDVERELRRLDPNFEAPWRATASVTKVLVGQGSPELLVFDRGWGAAACDDGTSIPNRGDKWVVYYVSSSPIAAAEVIVSYPLAMASRIDPKLSAYVR